MTTNLESIDGAAPATGGHGRRTQTEELPRLIGGVTYVSRLDDTHLHWAVEADDEEKHNAGVHPEAPLTSPERTTSCSRSSSR